MAEPIAVITLIAVCAIGYDCGARASPRTGLLGGGVLLVALIVVPGGSPVPYFLATLGPWAAGRYVRSRQDLVDSLAERKGELEAQQDVFARLAVRRERARIARELHDIVSHHLAVIVVQAGAGRVASSGRAASAERFASIRQSGGEALSEIARLADLLSDNGDGTHERGELQVLVDRAQAAGLKLDATPLPAGVRLPAEIETVAYRIVQEGLTNAMKHAPGSEVRLRLAVRAGELEVDLRDSGGSSLSGIAGTGAGLGLTGMRERVESLGGSFEASPVSGGWRLFARLPKG